jgi:hypothetical protein
MVRSIGGRPLDDARADASQTTYEDPVDPAGEEEVT